MSYVGNVTSNNEVHLVGSTLYGTCDTAADVAAKVVTCPKFDVLLTGVTIHVKFTNTNTAENPTLNVNNTGAKNIYIYGTTRPGVNESKSWFSGATVAFTYDGTNWIVNDFSGGVDYESITYAQWNAMTEEQRRAKDYFISDYPASAILASEVGYDNTSSELVSVTAQGAIDELSSKITTYAPVYLGSQTFTSSTFPTITLPSGWDILYVTFYVENQYCSFPFVVDKNGIDSSVNETIFRMGFYASTTDWARAHFKINSSRTSLTVIDCQQNNDSKGGKIIISYVKFGA